MDLCVGIGEVLCLQSFELLRLHLREALRRDGINLCEKLFNLSPKFITVDVSTNLGEFNYQCNHFRFLLLRDKTNIQRVSKRSQLYTKLKAGFCSWDFIDIKFSFKLPKQFFIFWTVQILLCYVLGVRWVQATACTWHSCLSCEHYKWSRCMKYLVN